MRRPLGFFLVFLSGFVLLLAVMHMIEWRHGIQDNWRFDPFETILMIVYLPFLFVIGCVMWLRK